MENQVQLFESEEFGRIRVVEVDGQPWFILKDICYVLNLSNPTMIAERLDDDEKEILKPKPGLVLDIPNRGLIIVNESGLYAVIIRSDKPEAKKFRRWITNEILPSIRQHGAYITDAVLDEMTRSREFADNLLHRLQSERHKTAAMREYIDELSPKARYCDVILRCQNAIQVSLIAKDYGMSAVAFNRLLHNLKIQYRIGGTWLLYQKYAGKGYTKSRTYYTASGCCVIHTYWTQEGRFFLYETLKALGILPLIESCRG